MATVSSRQRKPSKSAPGRWYVCSGQQAIPLADGPDTYLVSSSDVSTITVEVYDSADQNNPREVRPGGAVELSVKSVLFLKPKPPDSGTAEGQYASTS
jgi:hypothetical protein